MNVRLALVFAAACGGAKTPSPASENALGPAPLPAGAALRPVTLADVGLEPASMDRSADACVDFYQFACGGWLAANPIPADRARWARFSELDLRNNAAIAELMNAAVTAPTTPAETQMGDFYAACMDTAAAEKRTPKTATFEKVTKVKDAATWQSALITLHKLGLAAVFGASAEADLKDSTRNVLYVDAAGLGLPDRDYYFEASFADKRKAYQEHIARYMAMVGYDAKRATAAADRIMKIELDIAKLTKTGVEKRDIPALYNPMTVAELGAMTKSIAWAEYFAALQIDPGEKVIVATPNFFKGLDTIYAAHTHDAWNDYFGYHYASAFTLALPKRFDEEAFDLTKALTGATAQRPRTERCVDLTSESLGELVGQAYVARHFPGNSKDVANTMVDAIMSAMGREIDRLPWMSPETRGKAREKLAKIERLIGFPDKWRDYKFAVRRDDALANIEAASAFETHRRQSRAGKPVDRAEWLMSPQDVNAYYNPLANNTALPAGILQAPFFGAKRGIAVNMGGIGMVIGHELTHGFDDQGAQFGADGNMANWWQEADLAAFKGKGQCLKQQYDTFSPLPDQHVQGDLTLGENIADLGGVKMALYAYRELRSKAKELDVADGFSEDQQFFLAVGQAWCSHDRPDEAKRRLATDVHAPPKYRVFGALANLPEFAQAFSCKSGTPMAPADRCQVW